VLGKQPTTAHMLGCCSIEVRLGFVGPPFPVLSRCLPEPRRPGFTCSQATQRSPGAALLLRLL
jgi:hypothetical protein